MDYIRPGTKQSGVFAAIQKTESQVRRSVKHSLSGCDHQQELRTLLCPWGNGTENRFPKNRDAGGLSMMESSKLLCLVI